MATDIAPWEPLIEAVTLPDGVVVRELPPEEWRRAIFEDGRTFADIAQPWAGVHILVVESPDGRIIAQCPIYTVVHADGLYSDGTLDDHPKAALAFVGAVVTLLQRAKVGALYGLATPGQSAELLQRLGFDKVEADLYRADVPPPMEQT